MFENKIFGHEAVLAAAAVLMLAAAYNDARRFRIPNALCLALLVLFPFHAVLSPSAVAWPYHIVVFGLVLAVGVFLYTQKIVGAGDVKLLAVISLWAGPDLVGLLLVMTALAGGLLAAVTAARAYSRHRREKVQEEFSVSKTPVPYGVAIAIGGLCTLMAMSSPALLS